VWFVELGKKGQRGEGIIYKKVPSKKSNCMGTGSIREESGKRGYLEHIKRGSIRKKKN